MAGNINQLMCVHIEATGNTADIYTVTRGLEVVDIIAQPTATSGGATTQVANGASNMMTAGVATAAVAGTIARAATLLEAQLTLAAGGTIEATGSAADVAADIFVYVLPTTWIAG